MMMTRRDSLLLIIILLLYAALALAYGVVNPLFEAPDEHWHYFTAQYVADTGQLPVVSDPADPWLGQEAAQPPLYYLLAALLVAPVDTINARTTVWPNPFVHVGDASTPINKNAFVHGPWEAWPWHGYAQAAHLLRAFSTLLGVGTLLLLFGSGRLLWPHAPARALLAVALVAFLPQFLFIHSAVSNDPLITMLSAAVIYQLLRLWFSHYSRRRLLLLGVTLGLAILAKTAGLLLLLLSLFVLGWRWWQRREQRWTGFVGHLLLYVVFPAALISGWYLWRNWTLYGDPTAANQFVMIAGGDRQASLREVLGETSGLWTSLFAVFGWFNVRAPDWVYWVWNGLVVVALIGMLRALRPAAQERTAPVRRPEAALWLLLWVLLVYAGLVAFMLRTPAAQGRLLFPALVPLALGMGYGLDRAWRPLRLVAPVVALATSVYAVALVIPTTYALPPTGAAAVPPPAATSRQVPMGQGMGPGLELVAVDLQTPQVQPGEVVWVTLYWRATELPLDAPALVLEMFGRENALVGKAQTYHGGGLFPATLWPRDRLVQDREGIRLAADVEAPVVARLQLGLVGEAGRLTVAMVKVTPSTWPALPETTLARLEPGIELVQATVAPQTVHPGETVTVRLGWRVAAAPGRDLTTLVHLGQPGAPPLAVGDAPPLHGDYPTGFWQRGEVIAGDIYTLQVAADLLPGRYPVLVGLYDPATLQRIPLHSDGERQKHDVYIAGWITVE